MTFLDTLPEQNGSVAPRSSSHASSTHSSHSSTHHYSSTHLNHAHTHHHQTTRPRSSSVSSSAGHHQRMHHQHKQHHRSRSSSSSSLYYNNYRDDRSSSSNGYSSFLSRYVSKSTPMHDDTDAGRLIPINPPASAVDYLSSGWQNEGDIAASWKYMTKQKHDMINGLRLENASWRNWAKQRHRLKTISPKALNWMKDSDTTWLYGPLYKAAIDEFDLSRFGSQTAPTSSLPASSTPLPSSSTSSNVLLGSASIPMLPTDGSPSTFATPVLTPTGGLLSNGRVLKPVLKRKTASELFKADTLFHVQSDLKLSRWIQPYNKANESAVFKEHRQPKLRFNDSVEQCVSIDRDAISEEDDDDDGTDDVHDQENEDGNLSGDDKEHGRGNKGDEHVGETARDRQLRIPFSVKKKEHPRSIFRIDPTTLKAENWHGVELDDDEMLYGDDDQDYDDMLYDDRNYDDDGYDNYNGYDDYNGYNNNQGQYDYEYDYDNEYDYDYDYEEGDDLDLDHEDAAMHSPVASLESVAAAAAAAIQDIGTVKANGYAEGTEDEEGMFDEPIYLGNPYTGSETGYTGTTRSYGTSASHRHRLGARASFDFDQEAATAEVSYTRPAAPSSPTATLAQAASTGTFEAAATEPTEPAEATTTTIEKGSYFQIPLLLRKQPHQLQEQTLQREQSEKLEEQEQPRKNDRQLESLPPPQPQPQRQQTPSLQELQEQQHQHLQQQSAAIINGRPAISTAAALISEATLATATNATTTSASVQDRPFSVALPSSSSSASASSSSRPKVSALVRTPSRSPPRTPTLVVIDPKTSRPRVITQGNWVNYNNDRGLKQQAVDLATNVKDLVSWASSFVYNSHIF